jgi:hypothetical protein
MFNNQFTNRQQTRCDSPGKVLNVGQELLVIKANISKGTLALTTYLERTRHFCKAFCEYFLQLYQNVKLLDIAFFLYHSCRMKYF